MKLIKRYKLGDSIKIDWNKYNPNFVHDIIKDQYIENLMEMENPSEKGKDTKYNIYYIYEGPQGNKEIGYGLDLNQHPEYIEEAEKGIPEKRMREIYDKEILGNEIDVFQERIKKEGGNPNNIPRKWYMGLLDMYYQLENGIYKFPELWKAIANLDIVGVQRECLTKWKNEKGEYVPDYRRQELRINKWFNNKY